ncbi:MAG: YigZ family protein [Prevotellaceae bacterium]|jgi:uncharacterized YigZ family protein|nr:YigZ family protein [Prevotellaceae bacterium]
MDDTYKTISAISEGLYKEKGSRFIAFAIPVKSVDEIRDIVKDYRKRYYDARHVCYAYMLGAGRENFRSNDDGEPSGTAGRPILGQINSAQLTNVLVIVVRYFGGILLGTGGLLTAYKEAAANAIQQAGIIEKTVDCVLTVEFEYPLMNAVMQIIKEMDAQITKQHVEYNCMLEISIRKRDCAEFYDKLNKIDGVKTSVL